MRRATDNAVSLTQALFMRWNADSNDLSICALSTQKLFSASNAKAAMTEIDAVLEMYEGGKKRLEHRK